jgi:hypothetical protein
MSAILGYLPCKTGSTYYQWYSNNVAIVGQTLSGYTIAPLTNYLYKCKVSNSCICRTVDEVYSNIIMTVFRAVKIKASDQNVCSGDLVTFSATTSGLTNPDYVWLINGGEVYSGTGIAYSTYTRLINVGDLQVSCQALESGHTLISNVLDMRVHETFNNLQVVLNSFPTSTRILGSSYCYITGSTIATIEASTNPQSCGNSTYQWYRNYSPVATNQQYTVLSPELEGTVTCDIDLNCTCANPQVISSSGITIIYQNIFLYTGYLGSGAFPICSGGTAIFGVLVSGITFPWTVSWYKNCSFVSSGISMLYYDIPVSGDTYYAKIYDFNLGTEMYSNTLTADFIDVYYSLSGVTAAYSTTDDNERSLYVPMNQINSNFSETQNQILGFTIPFFKASSKNRTLRILGRFKGTGYLETGNTKTISITLKKNGTTLETLLSETRAIDEDIPFDGTFDKTFSILTNDVLSIMVYVGGDVYQGIDFEISDVTMIEIC